jgi:myo-inositol-1(or 4)-monophosphatase
VTASHGLADDLELLTAAVAEAARFAKARIGRDIPSWEKHPGHPVTEVDEGIDRLMRARLSGARPLYGWLSEESPDDPARLERARVWMVDPLDGTRAFLRHRPEFTVTAALVEHGRPIAACIANPATGEVFAAARGQGALLDGVVLRVGGTRSLSGARVLASRGESERRDWPSLLPGATVETISSIAYRVALVATGRFDAALTLWPKSEWDIAAAQLIVEEAGGLVTTATGAPLLYNKPTPTFPSVLAAAPGLHGVMLAALAP